MFCICFFFSFFPAFFLIVFLSASFLRSSPPTLPPNRCRVREVCGRGEQSWEEQRECKKERYGKKKGIRKKTGRGGASMRKRERGKGRECEEKGKKM